MSAGHDRHSGPYFFAPEPLPRPLLEEGLCCVDGVWPDGMWDFSVADETLRQRQERRALAVSVCKQCPVQQLCSEYASRNGQCGVWGGTVFHPSRKEGGDDKWENADAPAA
ncbi:WhiB family transcriptional regulator [Corynebacterium mayonis]|uniref:WhiB family transcriptional regulator n=1 Tax=Corynebacterium mayonis TaxID=3062461 RepID=UPI003140AA2D